MRPIRQSGSCAARLPVLKSIPMDTGSRANGRLAPTTLALKASEDLQNGIPLSGRTLPATFTDPDNTIFPKRYDRAAIVQRIDESARRADAGGDEKARAASLVELCFAYERET